MKAIIIVSVSLLVYYIGLVILTKMAFKKRKINLGLVINLIIPLYIIKTFVNVAIKHREDKTVVKKALGAIFLDYGVALAIMVEVILFGIEKQYIKVNSAKEKQRNTISVKLGLLLGRHGKLKTNFSNSLDDYVFAN